MMLPSVPRRTVNRLGIALVLSLSLGPVWSTPAAAQHLAVSNTLNLQRTEEVLDLPLAVVLKHAHAVDPNQLVVRDDRTGNPLPSQLYGLDPARPDRFLILVQVPASTTLHLTVRSEANPPAVAPLVFGREAPERKDDFAWENLLVTYRIYGPALQATGEITSGIDVWSKRTPNFVIDSFYKRDHEGSITRNKALSYHKDNGVGLDSYEVGPTRGCGGTAVFANGKLFVSKNYTTMKVLSSGPIRFAFEVGYAPWDADGTEVTETKRVVLDAGSRLNQIASTYTFQGKQQIDVAAGLAVHAGANALPLFGDDVLSVWDTPQDSTAGRIATGMVSIDSHHSLLALGHALMLFPVKSGQTFQYAAGSGWSKADMPAQDAWNDYLKLYLAQQQSPLKVRWERGK
jgi:Domain of unknown function (DUF4861)